MTTAKSKEELLHWIHETSFAVVELNLYLDTHPDDKEAMAHFNKHLEQRKKAMDLYEAQYGPLLIDGAAPTNHWSWATQPWPWEGGRC